jgi:hypothetical protein
MSSNPIASAILCTDKALNIQGFVVFWNHDLELSLSESFPHLFDHFRNPPSSRSDIAGSPSTHRVCLKQELTAKSSIRE